MSYVEEPPAKGTRPKNRRAITIQTATKLFYRKGYSNVSVAEIARATNVGPSAIFRHFSTKSELLVEAIRCGLRPFDELLASAMADDSQGSKSLQCLLRQLADLALDHRELGVLWLREARNLDEVVQKQLRSELRATTRSLAQFIQQDRPELGQQHADFLAWCVMGVLVSIGFHSLELPRDEYSELLVEMTSAVARIDMAEAVTSQSEAGDSPVLSGSRKDYLVNEAVELFAERGFGGVAVDEIGEAAGIAGPSIYSHFPSKQKLLLAAMERGNDLLRAEADAAFSSEDPPETQLSRLVTSYVSLAVRDRFLMTIVLSEVNQLDAADREFVRQQLRDYVDRWTELLLKYRSGDTTSARIRVQAVLLVVNNIVQTPHLRSEPGLEHSLWRIGGALLGLPETH